MLELWRPPSGAGDPIGCLTSTFTFSPGLFDEQCLARFLSIDSEPDREDLAFLLERETRLGSTYAGVLVDHTQAGVEHSLRWDVLPVRIPGAKQHAKLSLLAWTHHVRVIVTSANLSEQGYRANYEVATSVELAPDSVDRKIAADVIGFLRALVGFVSGADDSLPATARALAFLDAVEGHIQAWRPAARSDRRRQQLICTLPGRRGGQGARGALEEAISACRARKESPHTVWVASPFFDVDAKDNRAVAALCKSMGRGVKRDLRICVPQLRDQEAGSRPRLLAPRSLWTTPQSYRAETSVEALPDMDEDKNRRPWHAKLMLLGADVYTALMIGSSNFTSAGLGLVSNRNAEANLLMLADRAAYGRETGELEAVWPGTAEIADPDSAEWLGVSPETVEEEQAQSPPLPAGFVSATYRAGDDRLIVLRLDAAHLPKGWSISTVGNPASQLLSAGDWAQTGSQAIVELQWEVPEPPTKLLVAWDRFEAFLPLNVEDGRELPAPTILASMSADDMLAILAAADPSAAFRAWSSRHERSDEQEPGIDDATPTDLNPLRRHDIRETFLHRIRRRARVFAQMRVNLERPVWGRQQLEWRLHGMIGIEPLAQRYAREVENVSGDKGEALLTLSDLLMVLQEVDYKSTNGAMARDEFEAVYRPFLMTLAQQLDANVSTFGSTIDPEILGFWGRVVSQCRS
ncbi:MAG: phospholipase D-like domain-containing protein [Steroidobacteraceae bacterium]